MFHVYIKCQFYNPAQNEAVSIKVDFINREDENYPKIVLCIPPAMMQYYKCYNHMQVLGSMSLMAVKQETPKVNFGPFYIDSGYQEGSGFDSMLGFCYKMKESYPYMQIDWTEKIWSDQSCGFRNFSEYKLDIFVTFNDTVGRPLDKQKSISMPTKNGTCFEISMTEITLTIMREKQEKPSYWANNTALCLDMCVQKKISEDENLSR